MNVASHRIVDQGIVVHTPNGRSREYWAATINEKWQEQVSTILETGRRIEEAECELSKRDLQALLKRDLHISKTTALCLKAISQDNNINDLHDHHGDLLPANWTILYQLTFVEDDVFAAAVKDGRIHPKMSRKDAIALAPQKIPRPRKEPASERTPETKSGLLADEDKALLDVRKQVLTVAADLPPDRLRQFRDDLAVVFANIQDAINQKLKEGEE